MTYEQIIKKYAPLLREVTHIPQKEVEILLLFLLDKNPIWLHLNYKNECECEDILAKLVKKRATDFPLEYITARASFYGESFEVRENVLIPRPETEILVEKAEAILKDISNPKVVEIGVGSGIISVMLAKLIPNIEIIAVDINDDALALALLNAKKFGVEEKITFLKSDLFTNVPNKHFDMCISNPPYIKNDFKLPKNVTFEPSNALFGGDDGDELLKKIIDGTVENKIHYLYCEMGFDQKNRLEKYLKNYKLKSCEFYKDYENLDRGFCVEFDLDKVE
ncbi:MAG: peptide chain release factor N(5)-glutamine methyltransferase [Arcobacteraceae bacterium]|jgi:release factor glutamine methyltransferase|nr:peptide chain release factor N(5)-glutamine methyltransferase [Arcobacteraceae bacterium]